MTSSPFCERGGRLLTPFAFEFILSSELKRAIRSQNFLTLVTIEASCEYQGMIVSADEGTIHEVANIFAREVRDTDPFGRTDNGTLAIVLLDANFEHSSGVLDRMVSRIEHYRFPTAMRIAIGAACYPTHAVDAGTLKRHALAHASTNWWGTARPPAPSADQN